MSFDLFNLHLTHISYYIGHEHIHNKAIKCKSIKESGMFLCGSEIKAKQIQKDSNRERERVRDWEERMVGVSHERTLSEL